MIRTRSLVALACLLCYSMIAPDLAAQDQGPVELRVRVLDAVSEMPVEGATVVFLDSYGNRLASRVSDGLGWVHVEVRRRAAVRLRAGRVGYATVVTPLLDLGSDAFVDVKLRLAVDAVLLAPLEVVARRGRAPGRSPVLAHFDHRVRTGMGTYFTRDEIVRLRPQRVTDLLRQVSGVDVVTSGRGTRGELSMGRALFGRGGSGGCPVQIFLDGMLVTRPQAGPISVDDLVTPEGLEGIEVYRGLSTVPPEFLNMNAHCGVVALWSRRGPER